MFEKLIIFQVRNETLQKVSNILSEAKFIKGSLGELPQGLAQRLVDSNSKIAQSTLALCESLATAMGPPIKQHIRVLFPGFLQCLGDSKVFFSACFEYENLLVYFRSHRVISSTFSGLDSYRCYFLHQFLGRPVWLQGIFRRRDDQRRPQVGITDVAKRALDLVVREIVGK